MDLSNKSDVEMRKYFEKINKNNINAKKKSKCMYKNCDRYSIGSHAVSKNYHIKQISENNVVMSFMPKRIEDSKELILQEVGVNNASVFRGFCKEHDDIFKSVDKNGIRTVDDLFLQCYRSVCYWLHTLTVDGRMMEKIQKDVDDTMRTFCAEFIPIFDYNKFRFGDEYQSNKINYVSSVQKTKLILEKIIEQNRSQEKLEANKIISIEDIGIYYCRVDESIPVVLNTINTVNGGENIFHIVLPNERHTDIIVINSSFNKILLTEVWQENFSNMLNIIDLIESWMVACEVWYIKPSVIKNIEKERLDIICQDIRYRQGESKLWEPYDLSIFDELRLKYLSYYKNNNQLLDEREIQENEKFIIKEQMDIEKREKNMIKKFNELQFYGDFNSES